MGRKNKSGKKFIILRAGPVEERLIEFLQAKSFHTMSGAMVIREALAYRAEGKGMDVQKLFEEFQARETKDESTPA